MTKEQIEEKLNVAEQKGEWFEDLINSVQSRLNNLDERDTLWCGFDFKDMQTIKLWLLDEANDLKVDIKNLKKDLRCYE